MRVGTSTLFELTRNRLGRANKEMLEANTEVTTGKRLNSLSDAPLDVSRVVGLKESISSIGQLKENITTGKTWLESGEAALKNAGDLITDAKNLAISMTNGMMNQDDLNTAASKVNGILEQLVDLGNTKVENNFIFSGTSTDRRPFSMDAPENPTKVDYSGDDLPFKIKMGAKTEIDVGFNGKKVFTNPSLVVDQTNNKIDFKEEATGIAATFGAELTATIPEGSYTPDELASTVEAAMEKASADLASDGNGVNYSVNFNRATEKFTIMEDTATGPAALNDLSLLWESGTHAATSIAPDLGFEAVDDTGPPNGTNHVSDNEKKWGTFNTLLDLKGFLEAGNTDGVQRTISRLSADFNHINTLVSESGVKGKRLEIRENILNDLGINEEANRMKLEDADIVDAISKLQLKQFAYQAALNSSAKAMKISLLDFL